MSTIPKTCAGELFSSCAVAVQFVIYLERLNIKLNSRGLAFTGTKISLTWGLVLLLRNLCWHYEKQGVVQELYAAAQSGARSGRFLWVLPEGDFELLNNLSLFEEGPLAAKDKFEMVLGDSCGHRWQYRLKDQRWLFRALDKVESGHHCAFIRESQEWESSRLTADAAQLGLAFPVSLVWVEGGELMFAAKNHSMAQSSAAKFLMTKIERLARQLDCVEAIQKSDPFTLSQKILSAMDAVDRQRCIQVGGRSLLQYAKEQPQRGHSSSGEILERKKGIQILTRLEHMVHRLVQGPVYDRFLSNQILRLRKRREEISQFYFPKLGEDIFKKMYGVRGLLDVLKQSSLTAGGLLLESVDLQKDLESRFGKYQSWYKAQAEALKHSMRQVHTEIENIGVWQSSQQQSSVSQRLCDRIGSGSQWQRRFEGLDEMFRRLNKRLSHHVKGLKSWGYGYTAEQKKLSTVKADWLAQLDEVQAEWQDLCKQHSVDPETSMAQLCEMSIYSFECKSLDVQLTHFVAEKERRNLIYKDILEVIREWYAHAQSQKYPQFEQLVSVYNEAQNLLRYLPEKLRALHNDEREHNKATFSERVESVSHRLCEKLEDEVAGLRSVLWPHVVKKIGQQEFESLIHLKNLLTDLVELQYGVARPLGINHFPFVDTPWTVWLIRGGKQDPVETTEKLWAFLNHIDRVRARKQKSQQIQFLVPFESSLGEEFVLQGAGALKPYVPEKKRLARRDKDIGKVPRNVVSRPEAQMLVLQKSLEEQVRQEFTTGRRVEARVASTLDILNGKNLPL
ncbi:MAG: hypothetical protein OXT67_07185 [Zetaproteobacteria bacterium]|nr:hypothetical protein [Zetaproteobacteria bacterium]